jgi:argininosuccinate synthase
LPVPTILGVDGARQGGRRARRGDDYTILTTRAQDNELRAREAVDGGGRGAGVLSRDRIGALEMQNLSVGDNRSRLLHHLDSLRQLGAARPGTNLGALLGEGGETEDGRLARLRPRGSPRA